MCCCKVHTQCWWYIAEILGACWGDDAASWRQVGEKHTHSTSTIREKQFRSRIRWGAICKATYFTCSPPKITTIEMRNYVRNAGFVKLKGFFAKLKDCFAEL